MDERRGGKKQKPPWHLEYLVPRNLRASWWLLTIPNVTSLPVLNTHTHSHTHLRTLSTLHQGGQWGSLCVPCSTAGVFILLMLLAGHVFPICTNVLEPLTASSMGSLRLLIRSWSGCPSHWPCGYKRSCSLVDTMWLTLLCHTKMTLIEYLHSPSLWLLGPQD